MAEPDLLESAWARARQDTRCACRSAAFGLSVAIAGLLAAALAGLETPDDAQVETKLLMPLAVGLGAVAITCLAVLLFELAAAPLRQRDELRRAWAVPAPIDPDLALRNLRRRGWGLLAGLGAPDFSLDSGEVEQWTSEVVDLLAGHRGRAELERFLDASDGERKLVPALESRLKALDEIVESARVT